MKKEELGREVPFGVEGQEQQEQLEDKFSPSSHWRHEEQALWKRKAGCKTHMNMH